MNPGCGVPWTDRSMSSRECAALLPNVFFLNLELEFKHVCVDHLLVRCWIWENTCAILHRSRRYIDKWETSQESLENMNE
jgi:hypothetical protein